MGEWTRLTDGRCHSSAEIDAKSQGGSCACQSRPHSRRKRLTAKHRTFESAVTSLFLTTNTRPRSLTFPPPDMSPIYVRRWADITSCRRSAREETCNNLPHNRHRKRAIPLPSRAQSAPSDAQCRTILRMARRLGAKWSLFAGVNASANSRLYPMTLVVKPSTKGSSSPQSQTWGIQAFPRKCHPTTPSN